MIRYVAGALVILLSASISAQQPEWRFAFPQPSADSMSVVRDVQYGTSGTDSLRMDMFRPRGAAGSRAPVLIFFNRAFGSQQRNNPFYSAWAQVAASKGVTAILPDLRSESVEQDFGKLVAYLTEKGAEMGVDSAAIAVYAGSGNVSQALPLVEHPSQTAVKAAVMYYGGAQIAEYRRDLPVLFVRAGLDRPDLNRAIAAMATLAVTQNAPFTLVNHHSGYHGFETANDDDATRQVMEQTIDFVKRATTPSYQAAVKRGVQEATAAGHVLTGNARQAAAVYAELVAARPDDPRMRLAYGEALLGDAQFAAACAEFEKLRDKGLGYRDLGLPAARACMQKGDPNAAIAWLRSIPLRFLPPSVANEPVFAPLRNRPDFRAVFQPR